MNPARCGFIRSALCRHFALPEDCTRGPEPLRGLRLLDVGCGGGLLSEPLARMGAAVTGIDAAVDGVDAARAHAGLDPHLTGRITYRNAAAEELLAEGAQFDVVVSLEVIEHVIAPDKFVSTLAGLVRPGGALIMSTINRTALSYALAIVAAEHVLRFVPPHTHDWARFVTPAELAMLFRKSGLELVDVAGMVYHPLFNTWRLAPGLDVNYIAAAKKPHAASAEE